MNFLWKLGLCVLACNLAQGYSLQRASNTESDFSSRGDKKPVYQYGIMMDAGSSGTRAHIYTWLSRDSAVIPDVEQAPINQSVSEIPWSKKVQPGISDFEHDLSALLGYFAPILNYTKSKIPEQLHSSTPVYLRATAGMRLLSNESQEQILSVIRSIFSSSGFKFKSEWVSVITGQQEGMFGWIAVNALLHNFADDSHQTVGALDLGGASTQVTFVPVGGEPLADRDNVTFSDGQYYGAYAHSYLGYGNDQAQLAVSALIANLSEIAGQYSEFYNPCVPKGYNYTYEIDAGHNATMIGSSNYDECVALLVYFLDKNQTCPVENCTFDGVYQPAIPENMTFYAFSAYTYVYTFFQMSPNATIEELEEIVEPFCDSNWSELQVQYANNSDLAYLQDYCFMGSYMITLLTEGFGFSKNTSQLIIIPYMDGVELGWAYGAMLYEADLLPYNIANWRNILLVCSVGGMIVLVIVIVGGIIVCRQKQDSFRHRIKEPSHEEINLVVEEEQPLLLADNK